MNNIYSGYMVTPKSSAVHSRKQSSNSSYSQNPSITDGNDFITFVFPDFKSIESIRYEFPYDLISTEEVKLKGFELYLVEQWVSERKLSNVITTYTGSNEDEITALQLTLFTKNETKWPEHLKAFLNELIGLQHCKPKDTPYGILYVTNLSQFPSFLNLIEVEKGDIRDVWDIFTVNLNLKKLNCGGRSVLMLTKPTKSIEDKFNQTFKINPNIDLCYSSRELILILQVFLYYFNLLAANFCDGLFCNKTEEAISKWWELIGTKYYAVKPKTADLFSPMTISAIFSFTLAVRLRLSLVSGSIDVPKDPLDVERFRIAIGQFQKYNMKVSGNSTSVTSSTQFDSSPFNNSSSNNNNNNNSNNNNNNNHSGDNVTYFLDSITIDSLVAITNNKLNNQAFKNDFHKVKKLLKNTVSDISSGRTYLNLSSSAGIHLNDNNSNSNHLSDINALGELKTLDIDKMILYIQGKRLNYLFKGKGEPVNLHQVALSTVIFNEMSRHYDTRHQQSSHIHNTDHLSIPHPSHSNRTNNLSQTSSNDKLSFGKSDASIGNKYSENYISSSTENSDSNSDAKSGKIVAPEFDRLGMPNGNTDQSFGSRSEFAAKEELSYEYLLDNDKNFKRKLNRRSSFPYILKEVNLQLLEHLKNSGNIVELSAKLNKKKTNFELKNLNHSLVLKRSKSFSVLEDSLLTWDYNFSPSIDKLSSDFLSIKLQYLFNLKTGNAAFEKILNNLNSMYNTDSHTVKNGPFNNKNYKLYKNLSAKKIDELYTKLKSKEDVLNLKLKDVDLLNSRLVYEIRLLNGKIKDLKDNLKQLQDFRLKNLIENLNAYENKTLKLNLELHSYNSLRDMLMKTESVNSGLIRLEDDENLEKLKSSLDNKESSDNSNDKKEDNSKNEVGYTKLIYLFILTIIRDVWIIITSGDTPSHLRKAQIDEVKKIGTAVANSDNNEDRPQK
ncbi:hypothetical protein PACTADRAFT_184909 [Pachysolen tannophilus NRRL Y-2460]|uniref:STB6-like N-terminal domain-containing protein n=1 Tax=Pachysolen tannophilus NRRL Y-2460 TaxID=669874 RepID=A0A1E4U3E4_PACTA|nr:hypothetical protein PACTADRAFT_184909 [Pachysolen tannophilus NRRL Y-2460]